MIEIRPEEKDKTAKVLINVQIEAEVPTYLSRAGFFRMNVTTLIEDMLTQVEQVAIVDSTTEVEFTIDGVNQLVR